MRRILLGGLGVALGLFSTRATAQDNRPTTPPPQRAARLGQPVAAPGPSGADPEVTPAGLLRRRADVPVVADPAIGVPVGVPVGVPLSPQARVVVPGGVPVAGPGATGVPRVTEDRGTAAQPGATGYPTVVPTVMPQGGLPGSGGCLDAPLYDGCPTDAAVGRVAGCGRWRLTGEYLMWWSRAADLPPLVTTSSPNFNGILGAGDTRILAGGDGFGQTFHSGMRFGAVRWFGDSECRGIDARIFFLGQAASSFTATTGQYALLARPFINPNPGTPFFGSDAETISANGFAAGGVNVHLENQLWGAEANYRRYLFGNPCARVDALVGYRYLNYTETLQITEDFVRLPGSNMAIGTPAIAGTVIDRFRTENQFNGGQVGLTAELRRGRWSIDGRATVAFGNLNRVAEINGGQSLAFANGTVANYAGGLLAVQGANIGRFSDNVFAVVPEVGVNVGYQFTPRLRAFVGYNFLYLTNALRPGNVIDPYVDPARVPNFLTTPATPIPGLAHPTPQFRSAGFFVQGISFGLQYNW